MLWGGVYSLHPHPPPSLPITLSHSLFQPRSPSIPFIQSSSKPLFPQNLLLRYAREPNRRQSLKVLVLPTTLQAENPLRCLLGGESTCIVTAWQTYSKVRYYHSRFVCCCENGRGDIFSVIREFFKSDKFCCSLLLLLKLYHRIIKTHDPTKSLVAESSYLITTRLPFKRAQLFSAS